MTELDRFLSYILVSETNCWEWQGALSEKGYGVFNMGSRKEGNKRTIRAHRYSYMKYKGELGELLVCHKCDNRKCCNPDHLFLGTDEDNIRDMWAKGRQPPPLVQLGSANNNAILDDVKVAKIKSLLDTFNNKELGAMFGVKHSTISKIRTGRTWVHVQGSSNG